MILTVKAEAEAENKTKTKAETKEKSLIRGGWSGEWIRRSLPRRDDEQVFF